MSTYLAEDPRMRAEYNDLDLVIDEDIKKQLELELHRLATTDVLTRSSNRRHR